MVWSEWLEGLPLLQKQKGEKGKRRIKALCRSSTNATTQQISGHVMLPVWRPVVRNITYHLFVSQTFQHTFFSQKCILSHSMKQVVTYYIKQDSAHVWFCSSSTLVRCIKVLDRDNILTRWLMYTMIMGFYSSVEHWNYVDESFCPTW